MISTLAVDGRSAVVLLVEDNDDDVELTRLGFQRARVMMNLQHVSDGEECMAFLRKEGPYVNSPTPDIILLDLNMPRMNGTEVIEAIIGNNVFKHIPIIVLTSSEADTDVLQLHRLRCNSYIVKPVNFEKFMHVVKLIAEYWFNLVILPKPEESKIIT